MPSDLERDLQALLARSPGAPDPARRDALERELVARLPALPTRRRWPKIALGMGLGAALAVGACAMPVDYDAGVGHRLGIVVDHSVEVDPHAIAEYITDQYAPDEIRLSVSAERTRVVGDDGVPHETHEMRIGIDTIGGEDIDSDALWDDLVVAFPELGQGRLEDESFTATVHGTLGGRLSAAWLDVVIDREGVEAAKARVKEELLRELDAAGVEGDAQVEIVDDTDASGRQRREVRVWVEREE